MRTPPLADANVRAVTRCLLETERAVVRLRTRFPIGTTCSSSCSVTHPAALIIGKTPPICYAHHLDRPTERNHAAGSGQGPVLELPANEHRVFSEVEALRLRFLSGAEDRDVALGLVTFAGMRLSALGRWTP